MHYSEFITDTIAESHLLVVVFSSSANTSEQVLQEVECAVRKHIHILPFRTENVSPSKSLELFLYTRHWLDASTPPIEKYLRDLARTVKLWLATESAADLQEEPQAPAQEHETLVEAAPSQELAATDSPPPQPTSPIALLYKRGVQPDEDLLKWLEVNLRAQGYAVFIDRHLAIGVEWAREIERQVRGADAVIPLLSESSIQSEMLAWEVQTAHEAAQKQNGKPRLLPVRVNFTGYLPEELANILDPVEYFLWEGPESHARLLQVLLHALQNPPAGPSIPRPKLESVGGAVPLDSKLYIVRSSDEDFHRAIARQDSLVLVKGARQMGKTSLLARGLQQARKSGMKAVSTDFQKLDAPYLESITALY